MDFKIELKNFIYLIWRRKGLYQLSQIIYAFYLMAVYMSIINMNAFLLIYQGVEFVLVEINLFLFPQLHLTLEDKNYWDR